jgi:hypothetical protein
MGHGPAPDTTLCEPASCHWCCSHLAHLSRLIMFAFNSSWTALFSAGYLIWMADGGVQMLASIASSVIWLFLTSILWVNTNSIFGTMHNE